MSDASRLLEQIMTEFVYGMDKSPQVRAETMEALEYAIKSIAVEALTEVINEIEVMINDPGNKRNPQS